MILLPPNDVYVRSYSATSYREYFQSEYEGASSLDNIYAHRSWAHQPGARGYNFVYMSTELENEDQRNV